MVLKKRILTDYSDGQGKRRPTIFFPPQENLVHTDKNREECDENSEGDITNYCMQIFLNNACEK